MIERVYFKRILSSYQFGNVNFSRCCNIFPWQYAWSGCTIICCRFHTIYIPGQLFLLLCSLMMCANHGVHYGLIVALVCLHITRPPYHHYTDVSEGIEILVIRVRYILSNVYLKFSQFSQQSFMQYMGLCLFSLLIYIMMIVRIRVLYLIIIIKVWLICHCLGLDNETMVFAVCLSILIQ